MDNCQAYNLISESPNVEAEFNCEKKYCPKYTVSFYAETPWTNKFMSIVMQVISTSFVLFVKLFCFPMSTLRTQAY
jgi:hypothetical protein